MWKSQYFFNEVYMQDFINNELFDWVVPIISGLVEVKILFYNFVLTLQRFSIQLSNKQKSILYSFQEEIKGEQECVS